MSLKRLLVVIDEMEVGGSQRQIVHLLTGLDRDQWQPELVYFRNRSFLIDRLEAVGIPTHFVPKRGRLDARFVQDLASIIRRGQYDLIHAFSLTGELWSVVAKFLARSQTPLVASERNQQVHKPSWYWPIKRFILSQSAGLIANSTVGAQTTARHTRFQLSFFDTIPNGVEIPESMSAIERAAMRKSIGAPVGRMLCLFVGRLVPQKNLDCLIAAMAALPPDRRPWLAIAGDGPLRSHAEALIASYEITADASFLGERSDATRLMQVADFLVLPSHFEGLSNSLLESMAAGCPVIASAVGGTPELIEHDRTGLLFPSDDSYALAACIEQLTFDVAKRIRLSNEARDYVIRTYGVSALVQATTAVYERCIGRSCATRRRRQRLVMSRSAAEDGRT